MKKITSLTLIIITLFLINLSFANACSCALPAPPKESLEHSTAVFAGKVVDIDVPSGRVVGPLIEVSSADPVKVTFDVSKVWKGPKYKTLSLTTARDGVSCGYSFKKGEEYVVYAYGEAEKLSAGICSRTKVLANAQEDLQELGEGSLPTDSGSNFAPKSSHFAQILSIAAGLTILIIVIVLVVGRIKR